MILDVHNVVTRDGKLAICVKDRYNYPEITDSPLSEDEVQVIYESEQCHFWDSAEELVDWYGFGDHMRQDGRSGGWLVLDLPYQYDEEDCYLPADDPDREQAIDQFERFAKLEDSIGKLITHHRKMFLERVKNCNEAAERFDNRD